jgi:hypothetical protein
VKNFILIGNLYFDKCLQKFALKLMKSSDSSLYFGSFGNFEYTIGDDVRILKEGLIFVKGQSGFDMLDDNFGEHRFKKFGNSVILGNLTFRVLEDMCKF